VAPAIDVHGATLVVGVPSSNGLSDQRKPHLEVDHMTGTRRNSAIERLSVLRGALTDTNLQVISDFESETPRLTVINCDLQNDDGSPLLTEIITVRQINDRLVYCWTQGDPICDASASDRAYEMIRKALTVEDAPPVCR